MPIRLCILARFVTFLFCLVPPSLWAITVSEGPDFPNYSTGTPYILDLGINTFSGTVITSIPADSGDVFKVEVPVGMRINNVSRTVTGGGFTGAAGFNTEQLFGTGTAIFPGANGQPYPLSAGNYEGYIYASFSTATSWSMTISVEVEPDYTIDTRGDAITVTDNYGTGDTLEVFEPVAGSIKLAAAGRTFSVNGGPFITGDSGNLSLSGIGSITVNAGAGSDTINVGGFSGTTFPSLYINGGTGDDTVNLNGDITFFVNSYLNIYVQDDSPTPGAGTLIVAAGTNITTVNGGISVICSRNVTFNPGASFETSNGGIGIEANQQPTPTSGSFIGVSLNGAGTMLKSSGLGNVGVRGRGGNDPEGSQTGIYVGNGAQIIGTGTPNQVSISGTGGASTGMANCGVTVEGDGSAIYSEGAFLNVTGTAGADGSSHGIGISVLNGGEIRSDGTSGAVVNGTGAGMVGSGFNAGVEIRGVGSRIMTYFGPLSVSGTAGPGSPSGSSGSWGIVAADSATIGIQELVSPTQYRQATIAADSILIDATANITTADPNASIRLQKYTDATVIDVGGADAPGVLGLSVAELERVFTDNLIIATFGTGDITLTAPVTRPNGSYLGFSSNFSNARIRANTAGTDVSLGSGKVYLFNTRLAMPVTGVAPDTGYPQLKIAGGVEIFNFTSLDLTGTTLAGNVGDIFTILDNDGTEAVTGIFYGLAGGETLAWPGSPGLRARINYAGGDGNDVTLTLIGTFEVTNTDDSGTGSLRQALLDAAAAAGPDVISFHPSLSGATITLASEIVVDSAVTLDATGLSGGLTISGNDATRIFNVSSGKSLALLGLTLTRGNGSEANFNGPGGAVLNYGGTLTLTHCTLSGNSVINNSGGAIGSFGGTVTVTQCTLSGNSGGLGGAISNSGGMLMLQHCTLSGNSASLNGGAIQNWGTLTLAYSIVAGNTAPPNHGADIYNDGVSSPATVTRVGANLVQSLVNANGGTVTGSGTISTTAPLLAPLGNYGGPTQTTALLPGSPARNMATGSFATADQRGFPIVGTPDIGAYEAGTFTNYDAWIWETLASTTASHAADADPDGDSTTNHNEWLALTDPGNPASYHRITQIVRNGPNLDVTFPTVLGRTYSLEYSIDFAGWTNLGPGPGTGSPLTIGVGPITGYPRFFIRVRVGS